MPRGVVALEFAEVVGEAELLLVCQWLAGEYENGVPVHPGLDRRDVHRRERDAAVNAGDFGGEAGMQFVERQRHVCRSWGS
jgi:hypothetical protein